jgi:uncharacterized membrane protein
VRRWIVVLFAMSLMASIGTGVARSSQADHFTFTVFDVPGADNGRTDAHGINATGQIVGNYETGGSTDPGFARRGAGAQEHGYVRSAGGAFTTIDAPGATATSAEGINNSGQIVGNYQDAKLSWHGYVRSAAGAFTTLDVPGVDEEIELAGINDAGQIVGTFPDAKGAHGFVRSASGVFITIDMPGATATYAEGISASGKIVGYYLKGPQDNYVAHGYVRSVRGVFTTVDVPGKRDTRVYGINSNARIVGNFQDAAGKTHGWVRSAAGAFTTIDSPDSIETFAYGINDAGQVVGEDIVGNEQFRAYLATR